MAAGRTLNRLVSTVLVATVGVSALAVGRRADAGPPRRSGVSTTALDSRATSIAAAAAAAGNNRSTLRGRRAARKPDAAATTTRGGLGRLDGRLARPWPRTRIRRHAGSRGTAQAPHAFRTDPRDPRRPAGLAGAGARNPRSREARIRRDDDRSQRPQVDPRARPQPARGAPAATPAAPAPAQPPAQAGTPAPAPRSAQTRAAAGRRGGGRTRASARTGRTGASRRRHA